MPPLFVAKQRLPRVRRYPAVAEWALDSGGFSELQQHGRWRATPQQYADEISTIVETMGAPDFVAPQDWMSEPAMIEGGPLTGPGGPVAVGTGLSVAEHRSRTVENLLDLRDIAPEIPWLPVVQGYRLDDYLRCVDLYASAGVDLTLEPIVGVGSVCRRESTTEAVEIFRTLHELGIRIHGFGIKQRGIAQAWQYLESADSLAWSYNARAEASRARRLGLPSPSCRDDLAHCGNCPHYAAGWHDRTVGRARPWQPALL